MNRLLTLQNINKSFFQNSVLKDVNFELLTGEIHALMGENGAGKSTLMKIISGIYSADSGKIFINDEEFIHRLSPKIAAQMGISIVHQELSVIDELSIAENLFVGDIATKGVLGIVDYKTMQKVAGELLQQIGVQLSPKQLVGELSVSEKQLVEIAKAIRHKCSILIMDEPTSSLTPKEVNRLFVILKSLQEQGKGIIYISHKMEEISQIADRVTVLRDGKVTKTGYMKDITMNEIVRAMVGRDILKRDSRKFVVEEAKPLLEVRELNRKDKKVKHVSFTLHTGEILGFFGIIGAGRTELMEAIVGAARSTGTITLADKTIKIDSPYDALFNGVVIVTEDRRKTGLFPNFSIRDNVNLGRSIKESSWHGIGGLVRKGREKRVGSTYLDQLHVKCVSYDQNILELSGGNQQKVIIGRCLSASPKVIIFDEPTRGISIGSKDEIYKLINQLSQQEIGIIVVSSELPELLSITDRIIIMNKGSVKGIVDTSNTNEEELVSIAIKENV